jgi:MYXO-CTERM domain-containing protein
MKLTKSLILFVALVGSAFGTTVSFNLASDVGVKTSGGVFVGSSYTLNIGKYTGGALSTTSTFTNINPNFTILTSIAFATGGAEGYNGWAVIDAYDFNNDATFGNAQLFAWITDGGNNNALISGFGAIPLNGAIPNVLDTGITNANAPSLTYALGSFNPVGAQPSGPGAGNIILNNAAPVPEPSAALLGAIGALGLLRRRRN